MVIAEAVTCRERALFSVKKPMVWCPRCMKRSFIQVVTSGYIASRCHMDGNPRLESQQDIHAGEAHPLRRCVEATKMRIW